MQDNGAVGRALAERLSVRGDEVRIVQRQAPQALPVNAAFVRTNLEDAGEAQASLTDVDTVVCAVGVPYVSKIYVRVWPIAVRNLLDVSAKSGARGKTRD